MTPHPIGDSWTVAAVTGYRKHKFGNARVLAREDSLAFVRAAIEAAGTLYEFAAALPDRQAVDGRRTAYIIPGPERSRWLVRHLSHGGLLAPLTGDTFLPIRTPRPFNELRTAVRLRELGVPTPEVAAAVVYPTGLMYRGDVARLVVDDTRDLGECLFGEPRLAPAGRSEILAATGRLLEQVKRAGLIHPDLNLRNILIDSPEAHPAAHIIDLEKCRIEEHPSPRRFRGMLDRLRRSARKFESVTGQRISDGEWDALLNSMNSDHVAD